MFSSECLGRFEHRVHSLQYAQARNLFKSLARRRQSFAPRSHLREGSAAAAYQLIVKLQYEKYFSGYRFITK
jgi:hypothetical protein